MALCLTGSGGKAAETVCVCVCVCVFFPVYATIKTSALVVIKILYWRHQSVPNMYALRGTLVELSATKRCERTKTVEKPFFRRCELLFVEVVAACYHPV